MMVQGHLMSDLNTGSDIPQRTAATYSEQIQLFSLRRQGATTAKVPCALCSTLSNVYQIRSSNSSNMLGVGK